MDLRVLHEAVVSKNEAFENDSIIFLFSQASHILWDQGVFLLWHNVFLIAYGEGKYNTLLIIFGMTFLNFCLHFLSQEVN